MLTMPKTPLAALIALLLLASCGPLVGGGVAVDRTRLRRMPMGG